MSPLSCPQGALLSVLGARVLIVLGQEPVTDTIGFQLGRSLFLVCGQLLWIVLWGFHASKQQIKDGQVFVGWLSL